MLLRVWIICLGVWLMSHAYLSSLQAQTDAGPAAAGPTIAAIDSPTSANTRGALIPPTLTPS